MAHSNINNTSQPQLSVLLGLAIHLKSQTIAQVSVATGIRLSRVYRIVQGRLSPQATELKRLWEALGIDEVALTAIAASTSSIIPLLPLAIEQPNIGHQPARLVIDKLQFTSNLKNQSRLQSVVSRIDNATRTRPGKKSRYTECFVLGRGIYLATRPKYTGMRDAWLKLHPASPDFDEAIEVLGPEFVSSSIRVTGLDVAVDVAIPLREVQLIANDKHKFSVVVGSRGFQTMYSGVRSAGQLKVYDKIQNLNDKKKQGRWRDWTYSSLPEPPLTRIEATICDIKLGDIETIKNPFRDKFHCLPLRSDGLSLPDRLLVDFGRFCGWPLLKAHLGKGDFDFLAAKLDRAQETLSPHPANVFDCEWRAAVAPLLDSLRLGGLV